MSVEPPDEPPPTANEHRLHELLGLLVSEPPQPPSTLAPSVLAAARWERGLRSTGTTLGSFGVSFVEGVALLLGLRKQKR